MADPVHADRLHIPDASPLIVLARVGRVDVLGPVVVPRAVADEVLAGPEGDPARMFVERGRFDPCPDVIVPTSVQEWGLGAGESAVLALALETPGAVALLDDTQGRRCARAVGVPVIGTLGLVVRAARAGRLSGATPVLRDLRAAGLWLDDGLIADVLRRVLDEDWRP